jgi:hypothetical protein
VRKARRAAARRGRRLRIMFADEARFGRMNRIRPCWAPIGTRPEVAAQLIREYIYLYGAVSPEDGTCVYLIMPTSNTAASRPSSMCWHAGLPGKTSCWFSTARPITAAASLSFPATSPCCISRPIRRNSIQRKISGTKSVKNLQELCAQIHGCCARRAQASHSLHRAQSQARPLHHFLPLYRQLTLM